MKKSLMVLMAGCLFSVQAKAMDVQPYVGADYAYSWAQMKEKSHFKSRYQAINLSVGVMTTSTIALELSYMLSEQNKKASDWGQTKAEYKIYGLDGVYGLNLFDNVQGLFSLGLGYYETKVKAKTGGHFKHKDDEHFGLRAGIGAQYNLNENWAARMMLRYHYIKGDALRYMTDLTAGVRYYF